ncbi:MAG: XRE family transcriptional regulator [Bacteroidales bacterium]|nr:XRE family transcriptional regulator [Bacteroidales bacterium]
MEDIFSQRLKNARVMQGLSMDGLCDKMNGIVSKQAISKYERGEMMPNSSVLLALSKALNVSADYFFRTGVRLENVEFRKKASLSKKKEAQITEIVRDHLERYILIEEIVSMNTPFSNPIRNSAISNFNDIEIAVRELRKAWWIGLDSLPNITELLEDKGIKIIEIEADDKFDGLSANVNKGTIPVVVINKQWPVERKRFTCMHELGHLLLQLPSDLDEKAKENYCHYFANAMLLPCDAFLREIGPKRRHLSTSELIPIKEYFGISISAILKRARDLEVISESYYKSFYIRVLSKNRKEIGLGNYLGRESSNRFMQLLYRATSEELISMSRAAEIANMTLSDYREAYLS